MEFPKFDGDNPHLWRDRCETYFEVYSVAESLKTRFAALNFMGAAATWLQMMERRGLVIDWDLFCKMVFTRFDRDQYQLQLRQLDMLRQTGFAYDDTYFVTRFLGGLKEEIRAVIALHRLKDVESASALALLQEERLEQARRKSLGQDFTKFVLKSTVVTEQQKLPVSEKPKPRAEWEDKFDNLKLFRRKNGLCFKCGEKWTHGHKCPASVPIHVIEELLEVLKVDEDVNAAPEEIVEEVEEIVMAVAPAPTIAPPKRKTLRLHGKIASHDALILVDSGSVGRVWLGTNVLAHQHVMQALHSSGIGGHSRFHVTYNRIKGLFAWPHMKQSIKQFVQSCVVCQQAKGEHVKSLGLLEPLPVPTAPWVVVSMDFVERLPQSGRFNAILVVVDKLTKYGHFIPLAHPFTALHVAQEDRVFTSKLWQELFKLSDTHHELILSPTNRWPDRETQSVFGGISSLCSSFLSDLVAQMAFIAGVLLSFKFFGPFTILQKVGNVAYKLDLPPDCKIHNVVHVSQLKRHVPAQEVIQDDISAVPGDPDIDLQPVAALSHRVITVGSSSLSQLLVQWSHLPQGLATWEEEHDLHRRFPLAPVWGQPRFQGEGSVMDQMRAVASSG
ncbi:hypothetical protein U9M48_028591 [Paspalum notatum var. saurae]|uniref:Uncharacterized protein n=1 Tax=Paspalum notatum var. saurae TaxID=547442 RepID=A0AAQ3TWT1_PASNO